MNLLLLLLIVLGSLNQISDCNTFYKETLLPLSVKGDLQEKKETEQYFILKVKNEDTEIVEIRLLKNETGKKIFNFAKDKSKIIKIKDQTTIRVLAPLGDGGFFVQLFPDLCN